MTRRILPVLLALLLALLPVTMLAANDAGLVLQDMTGREIKLEKAATKIVALMPGDCEILYAIGAGDTLVGRGEWCNYPAEVLEVPSVESSYQINIEQVVALAPEVVIMTKMGQSQEHVAQLEKAGIQVFVSDAQSLQDTYTAIDLLGKLTGHEEEAAQLFSSMQEQLAQLAELVKDQPRTTVYFETSELQYGLWPAVGGTFMHELGEMLHLDNVFGDMTSWTEVSEEEVIKRNPDYIIATNTFTSDGRPAEEEITARPGWDAITAVQQGHVYTVNSDMINRPGPRLVDAAQELYNLVYGAEEVKKAS